MPQMSLQQARVINPVLTSIAQGIQNNDFVGRHLFPTVPVSMRAGQIITFGREDFMQYSGLVRAPGAATKRIQFGYAGDPFSLLDYSLEGSLPIETLQEGLATANGFSIDGAALAIRKVSAIMALRLEIAQAELATTFANYPVTNRVTLSGTGQWSDYSGTSNPAGVVETAKNAIRSLTGKRPNTAIIGPLVVSALKQHPQIRDQFKYTGREVVTLSMLSSFFEIPNLYVGEAIKANDAGVLSDVWGKHMILGFTEMASLQEMGTPTFGYTYNLEGYPIAEEAYYERNSKTWYFPVTRSEAPVIAGATAGYMIQNAVA
jgi:hypothetical protein